MNQNPYDHRAILEKKKNSNKNTLKPSHPLIEIPNLYYSRAGVAVDTRHSARCWGRPPRLCCNKVDAVR